MHEDDERKITSADDRRAKALARLEALKKPLPKGFRFDRDEANER